MKYQKPHKPLDERDKLRQFRELDDAFAKALRELEDPNNKLNIPTGPPVRSLATLEDDERKQREELRPSLEEQQAQAFRQRLEALLSTAPLSREELLDVIHTLVGLGQWPLDQAPSAAKSPWPVDQHN